MGMIDGIRSFAGASARAMGFGGIGQGTRDAARHDLPEFSGWAPRIRFAGGGTTGRGLSASRITVGVVTTQDAATLGKSLGAESLVGGDLFKCVPAAEKGDCSSDADDCAAVESGSYKVSSTRLEIPAPVLVMEFLPMPVLTAPTFRQTAPPTSAPSDLSSSWQFYSRTALPPRAPSFVS